MTNIEYNLPDGFGEFEKKIIGMKESLIEAKLESDRNWLRKENEERRKQELEQKLEQVLANPISKTKGIISAYAISNPNLIYEYDNIRKETFESHLYDCLNCVPLSYVLRQFSEQAHKKKLGLSGNVCINFFTNIQRFARREPEIIKETIGFNTANNINEPFICSNVAVRLVRNTSFYAEAIAKKIVEKYRNGIKTKNYLHINDPYCDHEETPLYFGLYKKMNDGKVYPHISNLTQIDNLVNASIDFLNIITSRDIIEAISHYKKTLSNLEKHKKEIKKETEEFISRLLIK